MGAACSRCGNERQEKQQRELELNMAKMRAKLKQNNQAAASGVGQKQLSNPL